MKAAAASCKLLILFVALAIKVNAANNISSSPQAQNGSIPMEPAITTLPPWEETALNIVSLIPDDNEDHGCIKETLKMAFEDVSKMNGYITFVGNNTQKEFKRYHYKMEPNYTKVGLNMSESINSLHSTYMTGPTKIATLGPPHKQTLDNFVEYSTVLGHTHVSYTDSNEPLEQYFVFFVQTPPSIIFQFEAAAALLKHFEWQRIGILYDFSDSKYRKNADALRETVKQYDTHLEEPDILTEEGIWSQLADSENIKQKMDMLQANDRRIILSLVSVRGARLVFCEAYHRKMYKPKVVWILFEKLADGWEKAGNDVDCTEDELLTAADGHIYITKQGMRKDNVPSVSGLTTEMFKKRLRKAVGENVDCGEDVAYAYDAVWVLAQGYRSLAKKVTLQSYTYYSYHFSYAFASEVSKMEFDGLTGPIKYKEMSNSIFKRMGQISYWAFKKGGQPVYLGTHHTSKNKLELLPGAKIVLFDSAGVPKDKAEFFYKFSNFEKPLLIAMWLVSFVGILIALIFLLVTIIFNKNGPSPIGSPMINCTIIVGSILCYVSIILYGLDTRLLDKESIPRVCFVFLCTLSFGFTMTFGGLFAKTWGIYKTYFTPEVTSKQTEIKQIPEWVLLLIVVTFLIVDAVILIAWGVIAPFKTSVQDVYISENFFADYVEIEQVVRCNCDHFYHLFIGLCCYKGILLLFGIFLAWQTKNAKFHLQHEAKQVAIAIYNVFGVSIIGVVCASVLLGTTKHTALYAIVAICVFICTTFTLFLVFVPKIKAILYPASEKTTATRTGSTRNEIYVRRSQREFGAEHERPNRELSEISSTFSVGTLNTQVSIDSNGVPSPMKPHSMLQDTLSGDSVVSYPPGYLAASNTFMPSLSSINVIAENPNTSEDENPNGSKVESASKDDNVLHEENNKIRDSGLGGDSPEFTHIVLTLSDAKDAVKNEQIEKVADDIDYAESPRSFTEMLKDEK